MSLNFLERSKNIVFEPIEHTYHVKSTGQKLVSVSNVIGEFKLPFDKDGSILKKCAKKEGISPKELKARWEKIKNDACDKGHLFHECAEHYIKKGKLKKDHPDNDIIEEFSKLKFDGELYSEVILYDEELGICGTADIVNVVDQNKRILALRDFKTNKALKTFSFGKYMKYPLNKFPDANFYHYTVQLGIYSYLLDKLGWWVKELELLWINPKTRKIEVLKVDYERKLIKDMLDYWKSGGKVKPVTKLDEVDQFLM